MPDIKWIKILTTMFDDEKIKIIESMPDRDTILVIWIKLLAQAGKCNASGYLMLSQNIPYTDEMLSTIFNRPINTVRLALETFKSFGMIDVEESMIHVSNWEKHQNVDGMERVRELARMRKQKQRESERQKLLVSRDCHVMSQESHAIDIDLELSNKKKKTKKTIKENTSVFSEIINGYTEDENLRKTLLDFIQHRKDIGKPMKSENTLNILLKELNKHESKIEVLEQSIMNGWQGIFTLKNDRQDKPKQGYVRRNDIANYRIGE